MNRSPLEDMMPRLHLWGPGWLNCDTVKQAGDNTADSL